MSSLIKETAFYSGVFIDRMMDGVFEDAVAYYHPRIIFFPSEEA